MNASEQERMAQLLKRSLPPVAEAIAKNREATIADTEGETGDGVQLAHDLWPGMLRRLRNDPAPAQWLEQAWFNQPWFDWALLAGAVLWLAFFPAVIPVLLYHL